MIGIIGNFDLSKQVPLDARMKVADQTARLALAWYFKGLKVRQVDNGKWYQYKGDETTNLAGDWEELPTIHRGTAAPSGTLGIIGDVYIDDTNRIYYLKTGASTWTSQFTFDGSQILISATDPPNNGDGENGDISIYSNGKIWKKIAGVWAFQFSIAGAAGADGDTYATTSATSVDITSASDPLSITVGTGKDYTVGQSVVGASRADNSNNFTGTVVSYNSGTGALVLNNLAYNGAGAFTDWDINLSGAQGSVGKALVHTEHDITLTQAKITAVEAGTYTPSDPWSASVLNDTRSPSELVATANIEGTMVDNSILWDGTRWWNNGLWRGRKGDKGDKGDKGNPGDQGDPGTNAIVREYDVNDNSNYVIPTESVAGNYEIYLNYISSTVGTPIITLPRQVAGINYKIFITLSSNDSTARQISIEFDGAGSNLSGILGLNGSITSGSLISITNGSLRASALFVLARNTQQNSFWVYAGTSMKEIISGGANNKAGANFSSYSSTVSRTYPSSSFPSIDMSGKQYVRPRVFFNIQAINNTDTDDDVTCIIQRSTSSTFASAVTTLKSVTFRVSDWMLLCSEIIDATCPKSLVYYRLVVNVPTTAILSIDYDTGIHMVPFDQE